MIPPALLVGIAPTTFPRPDKGLIMEKVFRGGTPPLIIIGICG